MSISKLIELMMKVYREGAGLPKIALMRLILSVADQILAALEGSGELPAIAFAAAEAEAKDAKETKKGKHKHEHDTMKEIELFCNATPPADVAAAPSGQLLLTALKLLLKLLLETAAK